MYTTKFTRPETVYSGASWKYLVAVEARLPSPTFWWISADSSGCTLKTSGAILAVRKTSQVQSVLENQMDELQELSLESLKDVSGGFWRGYIGGKLLDAAMDAVAGYNNYGAAAEFQMGAGSGAGTFG